MATHPRHGFRGAPPPPRFNLVSYCLGAVARERPDALALTVVRDLDAGDAGVQRFTFGQLDDAVRRVASGLRALGLSWTTTASGDVVPPRVVLRLPTTSDYALLLLGIMAAGYVALPASPMLTGTELAFVLDDAEASALVVDAGAEAELLANLRDDGRWGELRLITPEDIQRFIRESSPGDYADTAADDPALLIYTSGTTAQPKGVLHAQRVAWGRRPMLEGWYGGLGPDDTLLHTGAFNWTYTLGTGLLDPWSQGAAALIYTGASGTTGDLTVWPRLMERFGATVNASVPGLYRKLLRDVDLERYDLSRLRHGLVAGEALPLSLLKAWRSTTGTELYEALGMSECSTYISSSPSTPTKPGSPGRAQRERCVAVLPLDPRDGDEPLDEPGAVGLLAVHRSDPGLMLGYWRRSEEEKAVFRGEWFVGGDLAAFASDAYLRYHGRADDVMTALGYRVSPLEVESCLEEHPAVAEVAVAEVPLRRDVRVIAAFVVPTEAREADAGALLLHAREHLAAYKCPRELIFVDALPRTANGKVRRRELAQLAPDNK